MSVKSHDALNVYGIRGDVISSMSMTSGLPVYELSVHSLKVCDVCL